MQWNELYWLAGLLEGEGSFCTAPPSSTQNGILISLQMTDEDVIAKVSELFGVKYSAPKLRNPKHKQAYQLSLRGRRAKEVMLMIKPLMSLRRQQQIQRALDSYKSERNARNDRPLVLPSKQELAVLHEKLSLRELGKMFQCNHQTIANRLNAP